VEGPAFHALIVSGAVVVPDDLLPTITGAVFVSDDLAANHHRVDGAAVHPTHKSHAAVQAAILPTPHEGVRV
jgi:hypothetical protein